MKGNKKLSVEFNSNENSDRIFWRYIETHSEKCERKEEGKEYRAPNEMDYIYIYIYFFFFPPVEEGMQMSLWTGHRTNPFLLEGQTASQSSKFALTVLLKACLSQAGETDGYTLG